MTMKGENFLYLLYNWLVPKPSPNGHLMTHRTPRANGTQEKSWMRHVRERGVTR